MAKKLDPRLLNVLTAYGENPEEALWDCHGTWVAYHKAIERIAARAGIRYDKPEIIVNDPERKTVVICVNGYLNQATSDEVLSEWSFGEVSPANNKNPYIYAMAEKRAKDRVVLKLIGLHGLVYSEDEMDDAKAPKATPQDTEANPQAPIVTQYGEVDPEWQTDGKRMSSAEQTRQKIMAEFDRELSECATTVSLTALKIAWRKRAKAEGFNDALLATMKDRLDGHEASILANMSTEALAEVPLKTALKHSVLQAG